MSLPTKSDEMCGECLVVARLMVVMCISIFPVLERRRPLDHFDNRFDFANFICEGLLKLFPAVKECCLSFHIWVKGKGSAFDYLFIFLASMWFFNVTRPTLFVFLKIPVTVTLWPSAKGGWPQLTTFRLFPDSSLTVSVV